VNIDNESSEEINTSPSLESTFSFVFVLDSISLFTFPLIPSKTAILSFGTF